jgi:hypothetical protein
MRPRAGRVAAHILLKLGNEESLFEFFIVVRLRKETLARWETQAYHPKPRLTGHHSSLQRGKPKVLEDTGCKACVDDYKRRGVVT